MTIQSINKLQGYSLISFLTIAKYVVITSFFVDPNKLFTVKIERFLYSTDVAPPMNGSLRQGGNWSCQHGTRVTTNSDRQLRYSSYGSVVCVNTAYIICGCHCTIRILA